MGNRKKVFNNAVPAIAATSVGLIIVVMILVFGVILYNGWGQFSWKFLTTNPEEGMMQGGIFPAMMGTFYRVILMSIIGVPIGTITALFLCEYVSPDSFIRRTIRFAVNTLAGIPSIVFGLFGLGFFIQFIGPGLDKFLEPEGSSKWSQPNILWASLTMAVLTLPVVIVSVEEAIRNVPNDLREASLALGATKWETVWKIVLPNSMTGILTGAVLAVSRGAGEVAPILFTGAAYFLPNLPVSFTDQFMDMGYHIYIMSTQSPDVDATLPIQYATTLALLCLTFGLNLTAVFLRFRLRRKAAAH